MAIELDDDRKQRNRSTETELVRTGAMLLAVPAVVLALVAGLATRNILIALIVLLLVGAGLAAWAITTVRGYGASLVARPGGTEVTEEARPRLHNLVEGLCVAHGLTKPALVAVAGPGRNIANVTVGWGSATTNALVVSDPLLDDLSRIELEGVIAQQLSQFQDGSSSLGTLVAALGGLPVVGSVLASRLRTAVEPDRQARADIEGVRLTRYPPGLASALDTIASGSTEVAWADPRTAHLWLADPLPSGAPAPLVATDDVPSLEIRAATLREL